MCRWNKLTTRKAGQRAGAGEQPRTRRDHPQRKHARAKGSSPTFSAGDLVVWSLPCMDCGRPSSTCVLFGWFCFSFCAHDVTALLLREEKKWLSLDAVLHTWNSHKCCGSGKCLELFPNSRKRAYFYRFAQISFFNFSLPEATWTKSLRAINDTYRLWSRSRTKPPQGPFEVLRLPLRWKRIHMD